MKQFAVAIGVFLLFAAVHASQDITLTVFGSSTVWGNGLLGERSMAGVLDDIIRSSLSETVYPEQMKFSATPEKVSSRKLYKGIASKIKGVGSSVEFDISGNKLVIWQQKARTLDYGEMTVYADGVKIGSFDNLNNTMGHKKLVFKANGKAAMFPLGVPFTYNHKIFCNGKPVKFRLYNQPYVTGNISRYFPGFDGVVVRGRQNENVEHYLYFFTPPKGEITAEFDHGSTVAYTRCTVGETSEDDRTLESTFGTGRIPYDLANPSKFSTGLDFRYSNSDACQIFNFKDSKRRHIKIEITGGKNPYFAINFATNRNHRIMNAGIGGFTALNFLKDKSRRTVDDALKVLVPDSAFIILGGNDDWYEAERLVWREEKNLSFEQVKQLHSMFYKKIINQPDGKFTAVRNAGIIKDITPVSLVSEELKGKVVPVGSYIRIGSYYGDNQSTAVRRVKSFDGKNGVICWEKPLDPETIVGVSNINDLKGADFTVRTLAGYKKNISQMVEKLRKANPKIRIVLLNTYTTNYFCREVWGYAEALEDVAKCYPDTVSVDSSPAVYEWIKTQFANTRRKVNIKSTGAAAYNIPKTGHWQGFQVFVNGKDVYGKDCRVESGSFYTPVRKPDGSWKVGRTADWRKQPLKLVFTKNIPPAGTVIEVKLADKTWSNDYAHPTQDGCNIIGKVGFDALKSLIDGNNNK